MTVLGIRQGWLVRATMRAGHRLSAAARRLCRRPLPASDSRRLDAALARAAGHQTEVAIMALSTIQISPSRMTPFVLRRGASRIERRAKRRFDAALVLILANHIGDLDVLREAIELAKRRMVGREPATTQQQQ